MARHLPVTVAIVVGIVTVNVWTHAAQAPTPQDAKQGDAYNSEDRKVLTAVIDHTVRPKVQKVTPGSSAVIFLIDHTAPACDHREPRSQPFCMLGLVEDASGANLWGFRPIVQEAVPSAADRAELFASIGARNAERHTLPVSEGRDVRLVAEPPVVQTPSGETLTIYTLFSLPGYSSAGQTAVVSGFIDCGGPAWETWTVSNGRNKCGGVLVWVLEKRAADWQVRGLRGWFGSGDPDFKTAIYNTPLLK